MNNKHSEGTHHFILQRITAVVNLFLGVYVTRNGKYLKGRFEMSYNKAYNNGINGLVVHKTNRARVAGNVLWDNGKVDKNPPESNVELYLNEKRRAFS